MPMDGISKNIKNAAQELYDRVSRKSRRTSRRRAEPIDSSMSMPFAEGRDPLSLSATLSALTTDFGWEGHLLESLITDRWAEVVGLDIAAHSSVIEVKENVIVVECDSTAWATQLKLMKTSIIRNILDAFPEATIIDVVFRGPHAPSWKKGIRAVPGRGPRDTYG